MSTVVCSLTFGRHSTFRCGGNKIVRVENVMLQGVAATRCLQEVAAEYAADQITLGVPEEDQVPALQSALQAAEVPHRFGPGRLLSETPLYRLLQAISEFVSHALPAEFAALARHPMVYDWLTTRQSIAGDWLAELDDFLSRCLPATIGPQLLEGKAESHPGLVRAVIWWING